MTLQDIPLFKGAIPTKLLDYMACAKPVLCGIEGEAADIVSAAGAGVIFSPDDAEQLATLIVKLMQSPEVALKMGAGGLPFVRQFYSANMSQDKMEQILQQVVDTVESV